MRDISVEKVFTKGLAIFTVFGRAVHSLSKIGEELYIEPLEHGLALRTVNSSRSAYACFLFAPSFFQHYDDGSDQISSQDSDDSVRCKIGMKSILTVFKSLSNMEKTVEQCKIKLNLKESRLVFQLHCRHGIVKTHNLAFIECETLQAVFSKDMCVNSLTASSKLLCDAVLNFQNNQEEISLTVNPEKISLKNYVDDEPDPIKVMHTNLTLDPDEFDNCQVGVDTEITFCLKELRAILAFSEITTLPLTLHFETAGRPIVFSIDSDSTFEANFVLATLAEQSDLTQPSTQSRMSTQKRQNQRAGSRSYQPRPTASASRSSNVPNNRQEEDPNISNRAQGQDHRSERLESTHNESMEEENTDVHIDHSTTLNIPLQKACGSKTNNEDVDRLCDKDTDHVVNVTEMGDTNGSQVPSSSKESEGSPVIPMLGTKAKILLDTTVTDDVEMAEGSGEEDSVPGTPPAKRFRSIFFGLSQSQSQRSQNSSVSKVLAADTDDEDD